MRKAKLYPSVSVGIPAYNEERLIANVVVGILRQRRHNWKLKEILVYCDGCSDNTVREVRKINSKKIKVFDFPNRKGKTYRLSQMFKFFAGDYLVMLDADIKLNSMSVISNLIREFKDKNVALVGGNSRPLTPKSFFERAVFSTFNVFYKSRKNFKDGNNIFGCTGSCLAVNKTLAKKITFPKIINEDAFIYLTCLSKGYNFKYADNAVVNYHLPKNTRDYLRQVFRSDPKAVNIELNKYFGNLADKELKRQFLPYLKSVISEVIKNPLGTMYISTINLLCIPLFPIISKRYKLEWFTANSTH